MKKALLVLALAACETPEPQVPTAKPTPTFTSFADDRAFLSKLGDMKVLEGEGGARVLVSPKHQGRVMTSAVEENGRSFGWIHRAFLESGKTGTQFDNSGGEDRFWLGPEGGQFGLYFPPGKEMTFDNWQVPHDMQEGEWAVGACNATSCEMTRRMEVVNASGTKFTVGVRRRIEIEGRGTVARVLGVEPGNVKMVAYTSENEVTNEGPAGWSKDTGLLSIWILAMFAPAPDGKVVIPFAPGTGRVVNDAYFGKVPDDRLKIEADHLVFKVDGEQRGKIGILPSRAKPFAGSYSPSAKTLTIVVVDPPPDPKAPYVNSMWEKQKDPYAGDAINSYNDGPTGPGKPRLGGFYEIETSSPALSLEPKKAYVHRHRTMHFVGERADLSRIARAALGVDLASL